MTADRRTFTKPIVLQNAHFLMNNNLSIGTGGRNLNLGNYYNSPTLFPQETYAIANANDLKVHKDFEGQTFVNYTLAEQALEQAVKENKFKKQDVQIVQEYELQAS